MMITKEDILNQLGDAILYGEVKHGVCKAFHRLAHCEEALVSFDGRRVHQYYTYIHSNYKHKST